METSPWYLLNLLDCRNKTKKLKSMLQWKLQLIKLQMKMSIFLGFRWCEIFANGLFFHKSNSSSWYICCWWKLEHEIHWDLLHLVVFKPVDCFFNMFLTTSIRATVGFLDAFKCYLCYRMITSQMCHLRHSLRIFLFCRKVIFCNQHIQVFIILTIPWFTKSVTSLWVLVHETRCIFEYIFWTTTHLFTKLGQLIDVNKGNNFHESFEKLGRLGLSSRSFSIS